MTGNGCISFYQSIMNQNDHQNLCLVFMSFRSRSKQCVLGLVCTHQDIMDKRRGWYESWAINAHITSPFVRRTQKISLSILVTVYVANETEKHSFTDQTQWSCGSLWSSRWYGTQRGYSSPLYTQGGHPERGWFCIPKYGNQAQYIY